MQVLFVIACIVVVLVGAVLLALGVLVLIVLQYLRRKALSLRPPSDELSGAEDAVPEVVSRILLRAVPSTKLAQFRDGLRTPLDGVRMMNAYPLKKLWRYSVAPTIASFLVTSLVVAALIAIIVTAADNIHEQFDPTLIGRAREAGAFGLIVIFAGAIGFVVWLLMQMVFCGYFFTKLVVRVEHLLGTPEDELHEAPMTHQIADTVIDISRLLAINLGLLLLNVVPVLGSVVAAVGTACCNCLFAGYEFVDYPLAVRGLRRVPRREYGREHLWHTLGLGTSVVGLILIPGLGAVLLSAAVTGSALLYHRLNDDRN